MSDQQIEITRVFDAPREEVFRAWTEPDGVAAWFGPAQMETPRERVTIDLRVGGRYELTMVRRDGSGEFTIGYEIVELVVPELLVLRSDREPVLLRVELHHHGDNGTRMTLSDGPYPVEGRDGAAHGWQAAFDKLAAALVAR